MAWSSSALSHLIAMNGHFTSTMTLLLPYRVFVVVVISTVFFQRHAITTNFWRFFCCSLFELHNLFFRFATFTRSSVVYLFTHLAHVPFICNDSLLICFYQQIECNDFSPSLITPFNSIWNFCFFFFNFICLSQLLFCGRKTFFLDWLVINCNCSIKM